MMTTRMLAPVVGARLRWLLAESRCLAALTYDAVRFAIDDRLREVSARGRR